MNGHSPPVGLVTTPVTWPLDVELDEARLDLAREQGALYMHERAGGLVVNHGVWRNQLRRREERIAELKVYIAGLEQRLEEE